MPFDLFAVDDESSGGRPLVRGHDEGGLVSDYYDPFDPEGVDTDELNPISGGGDDEGVVSAWQTGL
jgi:hypothetical protein